MKILNRKIDELIPYANNARTHSENQVLRWQDYTGKLATLESTGELFNDLAVK